MKKLIAVLLAACALFALAACGGTKQETAPAPTEAPAAAQTPAPSEPDGGADWTTEGFFTDADGNMMSITLMDDVDEPGWYVAAMLGGDVGEDSWGGMLTPVGNALKGELPSSGEKAPISVTVTKNGETGILFAVEGGETYEFDVYQMPEATITVTVNVDGWGNFDYAQGEQAPEPDPEYPYQSAQINLAGPETHSFVAWPDEGWAFVKWTKNGEDFSTEPQITVLLDESADFIAVFEKSDDGQNPVMNFIGEYQSGRARALVECDGVDGARITIEWAGSAWETARWVIVGPLDTDTLTIAYAGCVKSVLTYDDKGELKSEEVEYEDGTGSVVFGEDMTFTWHEDQSEYGTDLVFEWAPSAE